ncbi:MAG: tetratricopeptide repeat protein [Myxococcota bacterium]
MARGPGALLALALLLPALGLGCASVFGTGPVRVSELTDDGDAPRRASMRLVERGLAADAAFQPSFALSRYERAIQVDPTNPFAYLALARHSLDGGEPERALEYLDQAEMFLQSQGQDSPRVEPHLDGLRGSALLAAGRSTEGVPLLDRARRAAPSVWGDGYLSADELR